MPGLRPFVKNGQQNVNLSTGRAGVGSGKAKSNGRNAFGSQTSSSSSGFGSGGGGAGPPVTLVKRAAARKVAPGPAFSYTQKDGQTQLSWMNNLLRDHLSAPFENLQEAFIDGVTLVKLIELITHERVAGVNRTPVTKTQKERNLTKCLDFLQNKGICLTRPTIPEICSEHNGIRAILQILQSLRAKHERNLRGGPPPKTAALTKSSDSLACLKDAKLAEIKRYQSTKPAISSPSSTRKVATVSAGAHPATNELNSTPVHPLTNDLNATLVGLHPATNSRSLNSTPVNPLTNGLNATPVGLHPATNSRSLNSTPVHPLTNEMNTNPVHPVAGSTTAFSITNINSQKANDSSVFVTTDDLLNSETMPHISKDTENEIHIIQLQPKSPSLVVVPPTPLAMTPAPGGPPSIEPRAAGGKTLVLPRPQKLHNGRVTSASTHSTTAIEKPLPSPLPPDALPGAFYELSPSPQRRHKPPAPPQPPGLHSPSPDFGVPSPFDSPQHHHYYTNPAFQNGDAVTQHPAPSPRVTPHNSQHVSSQSKTAMLKSTGVPGSVHSFLGSDVFSDVEDAASVLDYDSTPQETSTDPVNRPEPPLGYYSDRNMSGALGVRRDSLTSFSSTCPSEIPTLHQPAAPAIPAYHAKLLQLCEQKIGPPSTLYDSDTGASGISDSGLYTEDSEVVALRRRLAHLETTYQEVSRLMGVDQTALARRFNPEPAREEHRRRQLRHTRAPGNKEVKIINKRLVKLETHVVTLARSVAQLSAELGQVHQLMGERTETEAPSFVQSTELSVPEMDINQFSPENFAKVSVLHYLHYPRKIRKLSWFFGTEPPFVDRFLESLGYSDLVAIFNRERIGLLELGSMTEDGLLKMGIPIGPRTRILEEIQRVKLTKPPYAQ